MGVPVVVYDTESGTDLKGETLSCGNSWSAQRCIRIRRTKVARADVAFCLNFHRVPSCQSLFRPDLHLQTQHPLHCLYLLFRTTVLGVSKERGCVSL